MLSFHHVGREVNKVADLMANVGVTDVRASGRGRLEEFEGEEWIPRCRQLTAYDVGDRGQMTGIKREECGRDRRQQCPPMRHLL